MWPLGFFSERLFKVAGEGDGGEGADDSPPAPDGRVPLARRAYYVDVSSSLLPSLSLSRALARSLYGCGQLLSLGVVSVADPVFPRRCRVAV